MTEQLPFDALAYVAKKAVRLRTIPAATYRPTPTPEAPDPAPVVTPARDVIEVDPAQLPVAAVMPGGGVDLGQQIALVQEALRRQNLGQIRGVHGQRTFTSTLIWAAGDTKDVALSWEAAPLAACRHAQARMDVGIAWQGKLSAAVKPGSVTDSGCTVQVFATAAVVITLGSPLTVHADGTYLYWPPYGGTT